MRLVSTLTNRIFLASTLLATLSIGFAFVVVNRRASAEAEVELRRGLANAAALVDAHRASLTDTFLRQARLVADLPKLKAAVSTNDPPTVQPLAEDYRRVVKADLLVITGPTGHALAHAGAPIDALRTNDHLASPDAEFSSFMRHPRGILQLVSVPILLAPEPFAVLGRLTVGFFLDDRMAAQFKALTGSEVAFAADGHVLAASVPRPVWPRLASALGSTGIAPVTIGREEYLAVAQPMRTPDPLSSGLAHLPETLILRSRTEQLRFLNTLRTGLEGAVLLTILLATVLSYSVARTVTRPLSAVTSAMREVAATGDLTRKVALRSGPWDDEDARLLATAFNTLTDSIARFQREAAHKERLSSLGRLSTVIAHEIRNPLMIIRATLGTLQRDDATPVDVREAVSDIDQETRRLNRLVAEVLDFANPIRFDYAETDVNDLCRTSVAAAWAGASSAAVSLDLDATLPMVLTDGERLRTAMVNILTNARHAVHARHGLVPGRTSGDHGVESAGDVVVRTARHEGRVGITVIDRGIGMAPDEMSRIFDPYFTTRRTGTGLGLPISRNIIEGLGGHIDVTSRIGQGTEMHIDVPLRPTEAA